MSIKYQLCQFNSASSKVKSGVSDEEKVYLSICCWDGSKCDISVVYSSNLIFKGIQQTWVYVVCLVAANVEHLRENTRF